MAKKFVKVNGLHNVFEASANIASSTIKSRASASVDANSILFITTDADDEELFGSDYPSMKEGAHYIWAQGVLHDTNSGIVQVGITGDEWIDFSKSTMSPKGPAFVANHVSGSTGKSAGINTGTTTADAGGESIQFKVPKLTFDKAGHVSSATDVTYKVSLPTEGHTASDHKTLTVKINGGTTTYNTRSAVTIDVDSAINAKITNAIVYRGKEGSTGTAITDGATTKTVTMSDGSTLTVTANTSGDLIIGRDGIKEFLWNGSAWEQVGSEDRSVVSATATQTSGYEIGKITVNGSTTTFYGKDTITEVSYTNSGKTGSTYEIGKITINGTTTPIIGQDNNTDTIYGATNGVALTGGTFFQADLHSYTKFGVTGAASTTASRYYRVGLDAAGKLAVNVPWTNTAHTHSVGVGIGVTGAAKTGNTTGDCHLYLKPASSSAIGGIAIGYSENGKNYPVELNSSNQAYVNVPWTNTTYGASGGVELADSKFRASLHTWEKMGATGVASTTANRYYRVGLDAAGKLAVNVPWTDTKYTIPTVNDGKLTLQIAGVTTTTHSANTASNTTFNVPEASASAYGVIKVSSKNSSAVTVNAETTTAGRYYPIELNSDGKAIVNVPWTNTDTNTTYKLTGAVVGTTGSAATNTSQTTAVASAVSFVDQLRLTSTTGTVDSTSTCILMNGDGVINLKAVAGKTGAIEIDYTGVATAEDWATIG